ncbi:MAG: pyruvate carboxylase [Planctomycetes bacterium]|nr:pyruvate carboxylase [Planctomycetota bacterium]
MTESQAAPAPQEARQFRKVLAANRGEISIRVFRACTELQITTVAIYSEEDKLSLHRYKADESYLIGKGKGPVAAYLAIDDIVDLAKSIGVDAIHPGYGFLSERADFAEACEGAGIAFIGPRPETLRMAGDKVAARNLAIALGIPVVPGTPEPIEDADEALKLAKGFGYAVMVKAAHGGGGRGIRACRSASELRDAFPLAQREAQQAFGSGALFLEKMVERPRHIEVQVLGDKHGGLLHLYERDCSIQRRHQKLIETTPSLSLERSLRERLYEMTLALARAMRYENAGTFEFLVDPAGAPYFIEVNPRVQVEHTVTEVVTGVDIVQAQIRIAEGHRLDDPKLNLPRQDEVSPRGYAIQCRITTEDAAHGFTPQYGKITAYRSAAGFGVRLDAGSAFTGAVVTPYYDSLLVKVTAWGDTFPSAARRMLRTLAEFRVRGLTTNIPFLANVVGHPDFQAGRCDTGFIDSHPELLRFPERRDRATKLIRFLGDVTVHGNPEIGPRHKAPANVHPVVPAYPASEPPRRGTKQVLEESGPEGLAAWMLKQERLLITDTTFRDAHQSLLATRMRTKDLVHVGRAYAHRLPELFSMEVWGGATFDTAMRFLREDPWERLALLREAIPNILLQMLIRGANAVGYANYPPSVVKAFVKEAASTGIDVFRIFDSLNYVPGMAAAIEAVRETGRVAEAAFCYTGDICDPRRQRYSPKYYVQLAKELERRGAHVLGIKDMAGLCKPYAAQLLVKRLKEEVGIPIHFHTHDTSGIQAASILKASEAGVDAVDLAVASMSGCTSQVNLNSIAAVLQGQTRDPGLDVQALNQVSDYFEEVRKWYYPFESELRSGTSEVYEHEMPGGQYSNLKQQAASLGLAGRWADVKRAYAEANLLLGDIVKVTPSSKIVGDLALYMVSNNLTPEKVLEGDGAHSFPESVVGFFEGKIGRPPFGFPKKMRDVVLRGRPRSRARTKPLDLRKASKEVEGKVHREPTHRELLSYLMYPQVFLEFDRERKSHSEVQVVPTKNFFYGMDIGEEISVQIEKGKTVLLKLLSVGAPGPDGMRKLVFEVNGVPREIDIEDRTFTKKVVSRRKADPADLHQLAAAMQGLVAEVRAKPGQAVEQGEVLLVLEAMKMQVNVTAPIARTVKEVFVEKGARVEAGDLLLTFE